MLIRTGDYRYRQCRLFVIMPAAFRITQPPLALPLATPLAFPNGMPEASVNVSPTILATWQTRGDAAIMTYMTADMHAVDHRPVF